MTTARAHPPQEALGFPGRREPAADMIVTDADLPSAVVPGASSLARTAWARSTRSTSTRVADIDLRRVTDQPRYFQIPSQLWTNRWIAALDHGPAVVMLLVLWLESSKTIKETPTPWVWPNSSTSPGHPRDHLQPLTRG